MAFNIEWDKDGERLYETGVDRGTLYVKTTEGAYGPAVAWNGLTAVEESPSGAEANPIYADNIKYLNLLSVEEYAATITAYTYPEEFEICEGQPSILGMKIGQQNRRGFGFSYRSQIGNDEEGRDHDEIIHCIYNCLAAPSSRSHATEADSPEAMELSWEISTTPVAVSYDGTTYKPTATVEFKKSDYSSTVWAAIEDKLYGNATTPGALPTPEEWIEFLAGQPTPPTP